MIDQLLSRPEIQSAVMPFSIGILLSLLLRKSSPVAWCWIMLAAFLVSAGLINGLSFTPLTATRKIILLIILSFVVHGLFYHLGLDERLRRVLTALFAAAAFLWIFWAIAQRMAPLDMSQMVIGGILLLTFLSWAIDRLGPSSERFHAGGFGLLLGTGLCAAAGASALLGQLALSLAATSGSLLLAWVLLGDPSGSNSSTRSRGALPYALAAGLLGLAAVILAKVPWYALVPLATIPVATRLVPSVSGNRFLKALTGSLPGIVIALATAAWVWRSTSTASGY